MMSCVVMPTSLVKPKSIAVYLMLLVPSLGVAAVIWSIIAPDRLYHCWDDFPIICFFPPFVHRDAAVYDHGRLVLHDYYIWPEAAVYAIWLAIVAVAAFIPAIPLLLSKRGKHGSHATA
jgi:hypothetical protein